MENVYESNKIYNETLKCIVRMYHTYHFGCMAWFRTIVENALRDKSMVDFNSNQEFSRIRAYPSLGAENTPRLFECFTLVATQSMLNSPLAFRWLHVDQ
ncbi:hypothetical protein TNCT_229281 [Trichonephila clavata]|uniref:Uncharacterized protein n=1 Tax=Trichonephila clavata TaxID=2740835 RepID=A0A8X6FTN5_TRICU|nr:hypothetical protein TNCT_229281 [Trichonephila clavata]